MTKQLEVGKTYTSMNGDKWQCEENMSDEDTEQIIYKLPDGSFVDNGSALSCIYYWDEYGAYIGQEQLNCMDDDLDAPLTLFFRAQGNEAGELGLTQEEMDTAVQIGPGMKG